MYLYLAGLGQHSVAAARATNNGEEYNTLLLSSIIRGLGDLYKDILQLDPGSRHAKIPEVTLVYLMNTCLSRSQTNYDQVVVIRNS